MLNDSRRLQNASTNWVDFRGFPRTLVESTSSGKHRRINALASEVARHQQVTKTADSNSTPAASNIAHIGAARGGNLLLIEPPGPLAMPGEPDHGLPVAPDLLAYAELRCRGTEQALEAAELLLPRVLAHAAN